MSNFKPDFGPQCFDHFCEKQKCLAKVGHQKKIHKFWDRCTKFLWQVADTPNPNHTNFGGQIQLFIERNNKFCIRGLETYGPPCTIPIAYIEIWHLKKTEIRWCSGQHVCFPHQGSGVRSPPAPRFIIKKIHSKPMRIIEGMS